MAAATDAPAQATTQLDMVSPAESPAVPPVSEPAPESAPAASPGEPGAAARRVLAERKKANGGSVPTKKSVAPPPPPPMPTIAADSIDLTSLRPTTPTEVIELAVRHLGLDKAVVVERATQMLAPRSDKAVQRDPAELTPLWLALVSEHGGASSPVPDRDVEEPPAVAPDRNVEEPPAAPESSTEPMPSDDITPVIEVELDEETDIDLADLVDASHSRRGRHRAVDRGVPGRATDCHRR